MTFFFFSVFDSKSATVPGRGSTLGSNSTTTTVTAWLETTSLCVCLWGLYLDWPSSSAALAGCKHTESKTHSPIVISRSECFPSDHSCGFCFKAVSCQICSEIVMEKEYVETSWLQFGWIKEWHQQAWAQVPEMRGAPSPTLLQKVTINISSLRIIDDANKTQTDTKWWERDGKPKRHLKLK